MIFFPAVKTIRYDPLVVTGRDGAGPASSDVSHSNPTGSWGRRDAAETGAIAPFGGKARLGLLRQPRTGLPCAAPFGVLGQSGPGRAGGPDGILEFTQANIGVDR
jgi:hypothetical protein